MLPADARASEFDVALNGAFSDLRNEIIVRQIVIAGKERPCGREITASDRFRVRIDGLLQFWKFGMSFHERPTFRCSISSSFAENPVTPPAAAGNSSRCPCHSIA